MLLAKRNSAKRRKEKLEESLSKFKGIILDGVVPVNDELGRGSSGEVFTVRYVQLIRQL